MKGNEGIVIDSTPMQALHVAVRAIVQKPEPTIRIKRGRRRAGACSRRNEGIYKFKNGRPLVAPTNKHLTNVGANIVRPCAFNECPYKYYENERREQAPALRYEIEFSNKNAKPKQSSFILFILLALLGAL